jgi:hypothetical protein
VKPEEFASRMAEAASAFRPATELLRAVGRAAHEAIRAQIRRKAYRTGRLHDSGVERVVSESVRVEFTAPYAVFVDEGTRYIEARRFMAGGLEDAMPDIERELREFGDSVFGKVGGR